MIEIAAFAADLFGAAPEKGLRPKELLGAWRSTRVSPAFIERVVSTYALSCTPLPTRTRGAETPLMRPDFYDFPDALDRPRATNRLHFLLGDRY